LSVRRSLSVFCGCFLAAFFGFSERLAIGAMVACRWRRTARDVETAG
jgi:hypothetical protein